MKQQTARDFHIDNIKGVLIFLVVLGHMLGYLQETHSAFATGVRTFIYFFHMPGFIFMSGYLAKGFLTKEYKAEKLLSFAWLYLLFKDAIELVHFIFERPYFETAHHPSVWTLIVRCSAAAFGCSLLRTVNRAVPKSIYSGRSDFLSSENNMLTVGAAPWYLLSLIWWHIFLYLTKNMKPKYVLIGAVLLAAVIHYQEPVGKFLSLSRTIHFLPFFLMGYYIKKEQFQAVINNAKCRKALPCRSAAFRLHADSLWTRGTEISGGILLRDCPLCTAEKSAVSLCTAHLYPVDGGGCADALWSVYPLPEKGNLPLPIREKYHRYLYPAPPV